MQIVSEYIALLQDDVDPKNATEERHCCWQIEEVSGFVTPENEAPLLSLAGQCNQLLYVYNGVSPYLALARLQASLTTPFSPDMANSLHVDDRFLYIVQQAFLPGVPARAIHRGFF